VLWLMVLACGQEPAVPSPPPPPPSADPALAEAAAAERAGAAIGAVRKALQGRLTDALATGGPATALSACADEATGLTALSAGRGVRAGRATDRPRNPRNTGPDWVQAYLAPEGAARLVASGKDVVIAEEGGAKRARVVEPITVGPPCLICHGPSEGLGPELTALLAERYPEDRATGYALDEFRGVFWAEVEVE